MSKTGNLAALSAIFSANEVPQIYYAEDPPYLPRVLVFYWPVQAVGSLASTSRIRVTILSAAGFKSFGAFSIAPSSSYYSAVHKLPDDKQRDDVLRGIAFAMCKYFSEVPTDVKNAITDENLEAGIGLKWGQTHAAQVTCAMSRVLNTEEVIEALRPFMKEKPETQIAPQIRPVSSIRKTRPSYLPHELTHPATPARPGQVATPSKRITSSARRTPSNPISSAKKPVSTPSPPDLEQLEMLRFKMCELVDTEDRYIIRLDELIELITSQSRTAKSLNSKINNNKSQKAVNAMLQFPSLLDQIKDLNLAFLDDIEAALQTTEESAMSYIDNPPAQIPGQAAPKDPIGICAFAKVLLLHFPKFPVPYRSYLDFHSQVSSNLDQFLREDSTSIQVAPSLLMEPAQRISRYGLYIDTMLPHVPPSNTLAIRTLEKARKIIAEICEMEPAASTILDSLRIEHEAKRRTLSPTKLISGLTRGGTGGTVREAPALTGSLKEREGPRLLPSLSRSFSRKNKSRPGLGGILSEQDPSQASNVQAPTKLQSPSARNDENKRPWSTASAALSLSLRSKSRPNTSGSNSTPSAGTLSRPGTGDEPPIDNLSIAAQAYMVDETVEQVKARLFKVEEENYRLLAENAELKRLARECKCGGAVRR